MSHSKLDSKALDMLYEAVLTLENKEECAQFFEDLCTINELQSISQRIEVAWMLRDSLTYHEIAQQTHASTATISRVNRSLEYGADGYTLVFDRMDKQTKE